MQNSLFICSACGSQRVARSRWVNPNNNEVYDDFHGDSTEWCMKCKQETSLIEADLARLDRNGFPLYSGDMVEVPEPDDTDLHNHAFTGEIIDIRKGTGEEGWLATVRDSDDAYFEIECNRLQMSVTDDEPVNKEPLPKGRRLRTY